MGLSTHPRVVCEGLTYPRVACFGAIIGDLRDVMVTNRINCREATMNAGGRGIDFDQGRLKLQYIFPPIIGARDSRQNRVNGKARHYANHARTT
jgi:hypothetical protein